MANVFDPEVYGEAVFSDLLIEPEVYGEGPLAEESVFIGLAGASAGGAATASLLLLNLALHGLSDGVATTTSLIVANRKLNGTADGIATVTSVLSSTVGDMLGTSSGISTATSIMKPIRGLAATSAGVATATSGITRTVGLHGDSTPSSDALAHLLTLLHGASAGTSTATSVITPRTEMHGTSAGSSTATAAMLKIVLLSGHSIESDGSGSSMLSSSGIKTLNGKSAGRTSFGVGLTGGAALSGGTPVTGVVVTGGSSPGGSMPIDGLRYIAAHSTLAQLEAASVHDPVLVAMQDRAPSFVRSQPQARYIEFEILLLARTYQDRRDDYDSFLESLDSPSGVVTLQWTTEHGVTKSFEVAVLSVHPDAWFYRATASLIATVPDVLVAA